jgi:regulatory protein
MDQKPIIPLDYQTALNKAEVYCAYQERSQYEVRGKLISLGIYHQDLENIITALIESNFINEERFAKAYAQGKFRIKGWGKFKIKQGLKFKQVSPPLIKKALEQINKEEYLAQLEKVLSKKVDFEVKKIDAESKNKAIQYALSRGFESDLIFFLLKDKGLS